MKQSCVAKCLVLYLIGLCSIRYTVGTHFGPNFCLISRQDIVPCNVSTVSVPPSENQLGIYPTRYQFKPSTITCRVVNNRNRGIVPIFRNIDQVANVMLMFSPGSFVSPEQEYGNNLLIMFNIRCPQDNQLAYFVLNNVTLEDRTCLDPNLQKMRCVDYIQIDPETKNQETCGDDTTPFESILAFQSPEFSVTFRSSRANAFPGFRASVVCLTPADTDAEGCTEGVSGAPTSRKKRNTESVKHKMKTFHNKRRKLLAMLENGRHKRNCRPGHFSVAGRNLTILVPFAVNLMYEGGRLTFHDDVTGEPVDFTDNKLLAPLGSVSRLETLDIDGNLTGSFMNTALDESRQLLRFPGIGQLFVMGRIAMYQLFPPGVLPTPEEARAIADLTSTLFMAVGEEEPLNEEYLDAPTVPPEEINEIVFPCEDHEIEKRQDQMNLAQQNVDACNPVLQAAARAVDQFMKGSLP